MRASACCVLLMGCSEIDRVEEKLIGTWAVVQVDFDTGSGPEPYAAASGSLTLLDDYTGSNTEVRSEDDQILRNDVPFFLWDLFEPAKLSFDDQPALYEIWEIDDISRDEAVLSNRSGSGLAVFTLEKQSE